MKITFTDKTLIDNRPDLSDMEKITGGNINEIKKVVNANADELDTIKTSVEGFSTEIKTLKENDIKQDEKIEYLEKEAVRLRQDIEASQLTGEAEGESIDLEDSSGARFKKFGMNGNHSQETREGYNLLENKATTQTQNGVTITKNTDGTLVVNGTATSSFTFLIASNIALKNGEKYRLSGCPAGGADKKYALTMNQYYENQSHYTQDYGSGSLFTYNELSANTNSVYIRVIKDVTYNNLIFKPMIIAGENEKEYEQYGATPSLDFPSKIKAVKDNVNVVVCNKNILKILGLGERWEYTEKGIKNLYANPGIKISQLNLKKGQTVEIGFLLLSKVNNDISFVNFVNDKTGVIASFANIQNYNVNTIYKKKYTATDDCTIKTVLYGNVNEEIFEFQLWAECNQISNTYIKHQEQTITMPIQQEMLEGDYFDWKNEKQTNLFEKIVLNGVDKKCTTSKAVGDGSEFQWAFTVAQSLPYVRTVYSNVAKLASDFGKVNGIRISANSTTASVRSKIEVLNGKEATVENVNELLKTMYDNGNPATFYIEKASNRELDFTEEQKAVAKQIKETLHTYKNITHIYSTDETSPIFDVVYARDLNTVINNMQAQIINNASEEVNG